MPVISEKEFILRATCCIHYLTLPGNVYPVIESHNGQQSLGPLYLEVQSRVDTAHIIF